MQLSRAVNPSPIKSVQRGVISTSASFGGTLAVSAVNVGKSKLSVLGFTADVSSLQSSFPNLVLANSTTITFSMVSNIGTLKISWELIEYV